MLAPNPLSDALRARQKRALTRAFSLGLQAEVRPSGGGYYLVPSQSEPGLLHRVAVTRRRGPAGSQEHLACDCTAGVTGVPCSHAAAVWLFRLEQRTHGAVVAVRPA